MKKVVVLIILIIIMGCLTYLYTIKNTSKEIIYKAPQEVSEEDKNRVFDNAQVPVSNSNTEAGTIVFKPFDVYDSDEISFDDFYFDGKFYIRKLVTYEKYQEYKKVCSSLRDLTEEDFIYYNVILIVEPVDNATYTYGFIKEVNDFENSSEKLYIKRTDMTFTTSEETSKKVRGKGLEIIQANKTYEDVSQDKINVILE